jgi:hypothetical protein
MLQPLRITSREELAVQGLWSIQIAGEIAGQCGIVVLMNGTIQGGDGAYLYRGRYEIRDQTIKGTILVRTISSNFFRFMALLDAFEWVFEGILECNDLIVGEIAHAKDRNVTLPIEFRKQAPLPPAAVGSSVN